LERKELAMLPIWGRKAKAEEPTSVKVMKEVGYFMPKKPQYFVISNVMWRAMLEPEWILQGSESSLVIPPSHQLMSQLAWLLCPQPHIQLQ
jgi:hypothetical protein